MSADFVEIFWRLDKMIAAGFLALFLSFLAYAFLREAMDKQRKKELAGIRMRLEEHFASYPDSCPVFIEDWGARRLLSVIRRRGNDEQPQGFQDRVKECFLRSPKLPLIEKKARLSRNKWQRIEALLALGYIQPRSGCQILKEGLESLDEDVSYFSMLSLGRYRDRDAALILLSFLASKRFSGYKIASLLESFPSEITEDVLKAVEHGDAYVKFWGLKLLARFKPYVFLGRIERFAADPDPDVRAAACVCLAETGREAQNTLLECLKDKAWFVRMHAVRALSKLLGKECLPLVAGLSLDPSWLVKESVEKAMADHIEDALPYIDSCLVQPDRMTEASCINALIDSSYIPQLLKDALCDDPVKQGQAEKLLSRLLRTGLHFGLRKSLDQLSEDEKRKAFSILARLDPSAVAGLAKPEGAA